MKLFNRVFTGIILPLLFLVNFRGTAVSQINDNPITEAEKNQVIEKAFSLLKENYVFPEKVASMEKVVTEKQANGEYSKLLTAHAFLKQLNTDLETLGNDRHLNIFYDPIRVKQINLESKNTSTKPAFNTEFLERAKFENYMVRKAERLEGNVGYLKLDLFVDIQLSKPTLVSAMNFLSNSSALIIDLRQNGGGNASTVNFLLNYFLPDSTLVGHFTSRVTKTTTKLYMQHDEVVQKFSDDVALYILVAKRTSSAAEAFAYTLQAFKRAIIIGDTTNGEANPGYAYSVNKDMWMMIPTSINTNAVTKTNWQGVGVIPDEKISQEKAFTAGQAKAYEHLALKARNEQTKNRYQWLTLEFNAKVRPIEPSEKQLQSFAGTYADNRTIVFDEQGLFYERAGFTGKRKLYPLSENIFELEGAPYFRIRFIQSPTGKITGLEGIYDDGKKEFSSRL